MSSNLTEKDSAARDNSLASKNIGCNSTAAAASCRTALALSMRSESNRRNTTSRLTSELARMRPSAAEPNRISASSSSRRESMRVCEDCDSQARTAAGKASGILLSIVLSMASPLFDDAAKVAETVVPRGDIAAAGGEPQITQHFERAQEQPQGQPAGSDSREALLVEIGRWTLDEAPHQTIVVLCRRLAEQVADLEVSAGVLLKPIRMLVVVDKGQQLIQQARSRHTVAQPRLIGRQHEQHFVDQQLCIIGVVGAAQPQEQVDLVDTGKVPGVCTTIFLPADTVRLVVRPHRIEKPVDIQLVHQPVVESYDIAKRLLRGIKHDVRHGTGDSEMDDTRERIRRALQRKNSARVLVDEQEFIPQRGKALANAGARPIVCR